MELINLASINISPDQISLAFNIALGVLIAIVVLGGIIGLIRGVWNATFRLIFVGLLVIFAFVFCKDIANALGNMDLSGFTNNMTINIGGTSVPITTFKETLVEALKVYAESNPSLTSSINNPQTLELITNIAMMIIRFVTLILLGLVVFLVGDLILAPLFYHLLFKLFIPKATRKRIKLRIVGFFAGATKSVLVTALLITPFTSIINTLNQNKKNGDYTALIDNEFYNQIMSWIDAYDDSYFAQVLFNWTANKEGNTIDMVLVDQATKEGELSFIGELDSLTTVAYTLIQSGAISVNGTTTAIDLSILLNNTLISTLIAQLTASQIVMSALPVAAAIALNMDQVAAYIDQEKIDLDGIDWEDELKVIDKVYDAVYKSGAVDEILDNPSDMVNILFKEGRKVGISQALANIDDSKLLSQIVPVVIYKMANTVDADGNPSGLGAYLPTDWESYQGIKFGSEFSLIYESVFEVNAATSYKLIDAFVNTNNSEEGETGGEEPVSSRLPNAFSGRRNEEIEPSGSEEESTEEGNQTALDLILDNIDDILPHIVGELDQNGDPITDANGKSKNGKCLLDSDFLYRAIDKIILLGVDMITSGMEGIDIDKASIEETIEGFTTLQHYKKEFGALLNGASSIMTNPTLSDMIKSGQFDMENQEVRKALKDVLPILDRSVILGELLPSIVKSNLDSFNDTLSPYGLSKDDFDYDVDHFCLELSHLLDALDSIDNLSKALDETTTAGKINAINPEDVENILDIFHDSKILNPTRVVDGSTVKNKNFYKVIDYIFSIEGLEIENITTKIPNIDNIKWVSEKDGEGNTVRGENYQISQFFASLKNDSIIKLITDSNVQIQDSTQFKSATIEELFAAVDKSEVVKAAFGTVLDRTILPLLDVDTSLMTFTNVKDWTEEGKNLKLVIDGLQKINKAFDSISWLDETPEYISDILKNFSHSEAFATNGFSTFVFDKLQATMPDYLEDYPNNPEQQTYVQAEADFAAVTDWDTEIDHIVSIISSVQGLAAEDSTQKGTDGLDMLSNHTTSLSSAQIKSVLDAVNDCDSMRMVMVNAVDSIVTGNSLSIGNLKLSDTNVVILMDMDKNARSIEINQLVNMFDAVNNMDAESGITLEKVTSEDITGLLESMHDSRLFNTISEDKKETQTMTVFEQTVEEVINQTGFEDKIIAEGETVESKILAIGNNYASTKTMTDTKDGWIDETGETPTIGEITRIGEIITAYKNTGVTSFEFTGDTINTLVGSDEQLDKMNALLKAINASTLFYHSIPSVIDDAINQNAIKTDGITIDLTLINTDYNNGKKYEDVEIDNLTNTIKAMNAFNDIKKSDGTKIENPEIKDYDLTKLDTLFRRLHNSKLFNTTKTLKTHTFFENVVGGIIKKGGIDQKMSKPLLEIIQSIDNSSQTSTILDGWTKVDGEIDRLIKLMKSFQSIGLTNADISENPNLTSEKVEEVLTALNSSDTCYRALPGYIDDLLKQRSIAGVDLSAANTHYNGDLKYDASEITIISNLYNDIKNVDSLMSKSKDISTFGDEDILTLQGLLTKLSESNVFHVAGSAVRTLDTVFEQVMIKMMSDSSLNKMIYDATLYPTDANTTAIAKMKNKITSYADTEGDEDWTEEIARICNIIKVTKNNASGVTTPDTVDLSTLSPNSINAILNALNDSDLLYESVPIYTRKAFTSIKIGTLSEDKENYLVGRAVYKASEIKNVTTLLDGIKDRDGNYPNFSTFNILTFISSSLSVAPILEFLDCSNIFASINGLMFYNAINTAGYGQYVRTTYTDGDTNVFTKLFDNLDAAAIKVEGAALDSFLTNLSTIQNINLQGNDFQTDPIVNIFGSTYSGNTKYMFIGEILGGFLGMKLEESNLIQDGKTLEWFVDSKGKDFVYPLFNDVEKNGIQGALNAKKIASIDVASIRTISVDDFDACFNYMETGGVKSEIAMSIYQKGFYTPFTSSINSIVIPNATTFFYGDQVNLTLFNNNYPLMIGDPYDATFSFVDENTKVKNSLTALKNHALLLAGN